MEWWQTLIIATAPALVTLLGLLYQQRSNNEREDRRRAEDATQRERDRQHQAEQATSERNHQVAMLQEQRMAEYTKARDDLQLENERQDTQRSEMLMERWRDERKAAHVALLSGLADALGAIDTALQLLPASDEDRTLQQAELVQALPTDLKNSLSQYVANVQVIGSSRTRGAAEACVDEVNALDMQIWFASFGGHMKSDLFTHHSKCERLRLEYIEAVRSDLGTDVSPSMFSTYWPTMPDFIEPSDQVDPWG